MRYEAPRKARPYAGASFYRTKDAIGAIMKRERDSQVKADRVRRLKLRRQRGELISQHDLIGLGPEERDEIFLTK